jgi:glucose-6-phosphate isomerase
VHCAFTAEHPWLVIPDNVGPPFTDAALRSMDPHKTLVLAIAKSGGASETVWPFLKSSRGPAGRL